MGRKSSSSSPGEVGGGGGVGPATMVGLRMIQCGRQTVHVLQPDGQVRQFVVPVRVADLLRLYPHCFVSYATITTSNPAAAGGSGSSRRSSANILPFDAYLETGSIYAILHCLDSSPRRRRPPRTSAPASSPPRPPPGSSLAVALARRRRPRSRRTWSGCRPRPQPQRRRSPGGCGSRIWRSLPRTRCSSSLAETPPGNGTGRAKGGSSRPPRLTVSG